MKPVFAALFCILSFNVIAQSHGFPFGQATYRELDMKNYEQDTSAVAVILNEFGEAYIEDDNNYNLIFEYHVKIKILKQEGVDRANIEIPLYKQEAKKELIRSVTASSFNLENGSMREQKLDSKNIYTENINKNWDVRKFAIPNVRVGSVIEYQYILESPYIFKFRPWEFQADIPKVKSEYWTTIPGNYVYNTSLRGYLELSKHESEIIRECFYQRRADCARSKYAMENIPAFIEEDFMTAKSNFISGINFELSEVKHFDGRVDKYTKEWKDADRELKNDEKFGVQIRKGKDIVEQHVELAMSGVTDPLIKAQNIYGFIKHWYQWNETYGKYSELGIKKAFNERKGNVGDINLSLIAALRYAQLDVEPLILSTRENGLPIEIHPVLSDFNYVIAKLNLNDKVYLLDATDDFVPFGLIPIRCINGKGRVIGEKESYWYEIKSPDKARKVSRLDLKWEKDGFLRGTIQYSYFGYEAIKKRKEIGGFSSEQAYFEEMKSKHSKMQLLKTELANVDDLSVPLHEKFEVEIEAFDDMKAANFLFNPFIESIQRTNPFKSKQRLYPVDFGTPIDETIIFTMEYPEDLELTELPEKIALGLPNAGGRYLFAIQNTGNKIMMNNAFSINRIIYSPSEYYALKELFDRIIQVQNIDLVFKRKQP